MAKIQTVHALWRIRAHLKRGGVIAYPTESCYGIGGLPTHARAVQRILNIKKRPQHKGLIVIGSRLIQLQPLLCRLPDATQTILQQWWPAPKSVILPARANVFPSLRGKQRSQLAVRIPDHAIARQLCQQIGSALVSTSCNRAGRRPCRTEREVRRQFGKQLWIIGGQIGKRRQPSEIIDWNSQMRIR